MLKNEQTNQLSFDSRCRTLSSAAKCIQSIGFLSCLASHSFGSTHYTHALCNNCIHSNNYCYLMMRYHWYHDKHNIIRTCSAYLSKPVSPDNKNDNYYDDIIIWHHTTSSQSSYHTPQNGMQSLHYHGTGSATSCWGGPGTSCPESATASVTSSPAAQPHTPQGTKVNTAMIIPLSFT